MTQAEYPQKIKMAETAQQRLDLLHEFINQFVTFKEVVGPDPKDEETLESLKIGGRMDDFFTNHFEDIRVIRGQLIEWEVVNEKILPLRIEENNNLFLLRYARILAYMKYGYVDYDSEDEFFYKLYDICLGGIYDFEALEKYVFSNINSFEKCLQKELNKTLNDNLMSKYKTELKQSIEDFKKSYAKKKEDFYNCNYKAEKDQLHSINEKLENCKSQYNSYNT